MWVDSLDELDKVLSNFSKRSYGKDYIIKKPRTGKNKDKYAIFTKGDLCHQDQKVSLDERQTIWWWRKFLRTMLDRRTFRRFGY